jgi:hypothetical protein
LISDGASILHHLALGITNDYRPKKDRAAAASQRITFNRDSLEKVRKEPRGGAELTTSGICVDKP